MTWDSSSQSDASPTAHSLASISDQAWDLLIIGGGITGAGILYEAGLHGLRALLVDQNDFASGTSSCSSKLVHGGFHYLSRLQLGLVRDAVRERERLLRESSGLVDAIDFVVPTFGGEQIPHWMFIAGLGAYHAFAGRLVIPRQLSANEARQRIPGLNEALLRAYTFGDATVDDARLVLCVLRDACRLGGQAMNYLTAIELLRDTKGDVVGAALEDRFSGETGEVRARAVINATGPWADRLRQEIDAPPRLRLVSGSHILLASTRLPVSHVIAARHPDSNLSIHVVPWEGVTLVGTTNVERNCLSDQQPGITLEEVDYLLRGVQRLFPKLAITAGDVLSTFSGVRPIVDKRTGEPGKASRDSAIWDERGLLTVTGGKLTTFRLTASRVLKRLRYRLSPSDNVNGHRPNTEMFDSDQSPFDAASTRRLLSRYGPEGVRAMAAMLPVDREPLPGQSALWAELRWAARTEQVRRLDDLLLRRLRIGVTTSHGGLLWIDQIRDTVQAELNWDDRRWNCEVNAYRDILNRFYSVPRI